MSLKIPPFSKEQIEEIDSLINPLNDIQIAWLSGYIAGICKENRTDVSVDTGNVGVDERLEQSMTILYGSRTGNGKLMAQIAKEMAEELGVSAVLKSMEDYKAKDLAAEKNLLVIVSTHGDGEPPFQAKALHDFIHGKRAPKLLDTRYAVLALGDSSYFHFCKTGHEFDLQLAKLGAHRVKDILTCDVDFQQSGEKWIHELIHHFKSFSGGSELGSIKKVKTYSLEKKALKFTKLHPLAAPVIEKINLHGRGSDRQTLHIELEVGSEQLSFEPGDSAGIIPVNSKTLIKEVLKASKLDANEIVTVKDIQFSLYDALYSEFELSKITPDTIKKYLELFPNKELQNLAKNSSSLQSYIFGRDIVDLIEDYPAKLSAEQLLKILKPLQPRYYSIASSQNAYPDELHLTVALVDYKHGGRSKRGTCSGFLSDVIADDEHVPVFIETNPNFRLPANPATPIIMIGAGTGIAPYRAFIQERELSPNTGKSWLFFGNRNFENEFLYQTEWQQYLKSGILTRMDVAFSRDQDKPVYVQHRMIEHSEDIYQWIQEGSYIYICGDMKKMAVDVQKALRTIIQQEGGLNPEEAQELLDQLQRDKRLQLDVY